MLSNTKSISLLGLEGCLIDVEVDISPGLPLWQIVGLPDTSIKEAKERVRVAIKNSGYNIQSRKIVINLAPADTKKEGSFLDLPIAIGVLTCMGVIRKDSVANLILIGELSLDGKLNKINGVLAICIEAKKLGIKKIILPQENIQEATIVKGIEVIALNTLIDVVEYLNFGKYIKKEIKNIKQEEKNECDFSEVKGQENVKRALEIAAAGGHNILLIGSPGAGKTMLAKRVPSILPNLNFDEALETTKIHSVTGILENNTALISKRPFRSPHHTISSSALIGGGKIPAPGEISLAHNGVLFLDELAEFNKNVIEVLRGPLEEKTVTISRINSTLTYPCNFMLVASMNPCPCGYYGSKEKQCICSSNTINKYIGKISGPILDRIDIQIEVLPVKYEKLELNNLEETSEQIKKRVDKARKIQIERYKEENIYSNSMLNSNLINKYCKLEQEGKSLMEKAFKVMGLSARGYSRILKVSRTIADLEGKENIETAHLAEAIQYRSLDKKYKNR